MILIKSGWVEMDFNGMKRKKLQALCKKHKIPGNLSNLRMVNLLSQLFKDGEKTILHGKLKNHDENVSKIDSSDAIVQRTVKKVRFSPENELFEFTRPAELKRRSRRASVLSRYGTGLSIENVGHNGAALIGGYESQISQSKVPTCGISDKKRGRGGAESFATVENINEKRSTGRTNQSKRNVLVDNVDQVGKEDSKRVNIVAAVVKNAVDSINDENLVAQVDNIPGRLTRFRSKKLKEAYVTRENSKRRVVDDKVNVTSVGGGNDEKKAVNRRSLRNRHVVGEAEHSRNLEEVTDNGEGQVKILKEKNVKISVVGEPHVAPRRSGRNADKYNGCGAFNDDFKKLENRSNRDLRKTRNQVVFNCSEIPAQIKTVNRRSLRNRHVVGEAEHSHNLEEVTDNNGEVQVKILKEKNVKISVVGEPHVAPRRSRRNADKHNGCGAFNDDVKKLENRGNRGLRKTRNQVVLNCSEVPAQIRRSIRNTSKCKVNNVVQELDVNPVTQPENKKRKRKMRNISGENATQSNIDLSSQKPSKQLENISEKTSLLHDEVLDTREASLLENPQVSVLKPTQSAAKNDITKNHGKGEAASDVSVDADELKAVYMNGEEKELSSFSDIHKVPLSELTVHESIEQIVSDRDQNRRDHIVLGQLENSTGDSRMNNMGPSGSLQFSLNMDFADSSSFSSSPLRDELPDIEVNAEVAVAEALKCAQPSLQVIDHVHQLEGFFIQHNQEYVEVEHSDEKIISISCHHNDLVMLQASAKISEDTARTSTAGEACDLETYENFYHSVGSNSLQAKRSAPDMPRNNSDGDDNIAERYETDSPKGINTELAKTANGRSKKNHNVASDKNRKFNVTDLFDDETSTRIISQKTGFSADQCPFVNFVSDTITDRDDGLSLEDKNAKHDGDRDLRISDLCYDEIQTQTLRERGEFTGDISTNSFEEKERLNETAVSAPMVEVKLTSGSEADKIVEDGRTDDQIRAEKGHLEDDQIRTDVEREFSISNLFGIEEITEITQDVRISSLEVSLKNSVVPQSFSAENFRTMTPSSQEKVNLKTSNLLKSQEAVVGGIIQVKEIEVQAEASRDEISKDKPFSEKTFVEENETLNQAVVSIEKDTACGMTIGAEAVVEILQVKEVKVQTDANRDEVSEDYTVAKEIIENSKQADVFDTEEPACGTAMKSEAAFAGTIQVKEVKIQKDDSREEIIKGKTVSYEETETLNQAGVCTQNDTDEPEARLKSPLSTPFDMTNSFQMEEVVFSGILGAHNLISEIETNGNAGSTEVVEGLVSYKDADHVKTSNANTECITDSLEDAVAEQKLEATIYEAYATAGTQDKSFGEASFEEAKETGAKCDGIGVTGNRVTDSDEVSTDMKPIRNCTDNELCDLLGTILDCVARSESSDTCSQGTEVANMTLSASKSTPNFCCSFEKVEIEGESGSDCLVESYRDVILSDETNQVSHNGWDEDLEGNQLKLLFSTPMKFMTPNEVDKNLEKSDKNLGDATTHGHASNKVKSLGLLNPFTDVEASDNKLSENTHESPIQILKDKSIEEDIVSREDLSPDVEANHDNTGVMNKKMMEITCTKLDITTDCYQTSNLPNDNLSSIASEEDATIWRDIANDDIEGSVDPEIANIGSFDGKNATSDKDNSPNSTGKISDEMRTISESAASDFYSLGGFQSTCKDTTEEETSMEAMDNIMPTSETAGPTKNVAASSTPTSLAIHLLSEENENPRIEKSESKLNAVTFAGDRHKTGEEAIIFSPGFSVPELHFVETVVDSKDNLASVLKMPASECDEVLKETDMADTIKEYIDCEPFVPINFDDSSRDLNLSIEASNYIDETTSDNKSHLDGLPEEDINAGLCNFERDEDKSIDIEGQEIEQAIQLMESELDSKKVTESPTCVDPLFKEVSAVKDTETSKKETELEQSIKPSSRHPCSISKNNARTILIHGTPSKVIDMKENQ